MKFKFPSHEYEGTVPFHAHRHWQSGWTVKGTRLRQLNAEDAGRRTSLIRVVTHAVVGRAWWVNVAVAAQLL